MNETWLPLLGFENNYEVSDLGAIRSVNRSLLQSNGVSKKLKGKTLRPQKLANGYLYVNLWKQGTMTKKLIHRAVLETFSGIPNHGQECRHKDGNKTNNHVGNLQWGSHFENMQDLFTGKGHHNSRKTHCKRGHALSGLNLKMLPGGRRNCMACSKAGREVRKRSLDQSCVKAIADRYYKATSDQPTKESA